MSNGQTTVTWLGHATFLFETPEGKRILLDPWIEGNPAFPAAQKERATANLDAILLTHGHFDHTASVVGIAKQSGAKTACILELGAWLVHNGVAQEQVIGYNKGGTIEIAGIKATLTTAHHSSSLSENGLPVYLGDPCGFVLRFSDGCTIYHAGDTAVHGDMALIGQIYRPQVAILPIGDFYTMGPFEAAHAVRLIGAKTTIPEHYGTFPALHGTPDQLRQELTNLGVSSDVVALKPGESWVFQG